MAVVDLDDWDTPRLPETQSRVATAAIRRSERLGPRWSRLAIRLGITRTAEITVIADVAKWIWKEMAAHLTGSTGVLDIYTRHGTPAPRGGGAARPEQASGRRWYEQLRRELLEHGAAGVLQRLEPMPEEPTGLVTYLKPPVDHTAYRQRLVKGPSIGSGMVEGACKTAIGHRLKQTGARWRIRRLEHMAALYSLVYSNQCEAYWKQADT